MGDHVAATGQHSHIRFAHAHRASRLAAAIAVLFACLPASIALARSLTLSDTGRLHLTSHHAFTLNEQGSASGTISGTIYIHLTVVSTNRVTAEVSIYPSGGSITGYASASYRPSGGVATFTGTMSRPARNRPLRRRPRLRPVASPARSSVQTTPSRCTSAAGCPLEAVRGADGRDEPARGTDRPSCRRCSARRCAPPRRVGRHRGRHAGRLLQPRPAGRAYDDHLRLPPGHRRRHRAAAADRDGPAHAGGHELHDDHARPGDLPARRAARTTALPAARRTRAWATGPPLSKCRSAPAPGHEIPEVQALAGPSPNGNLVVLFYANGLYPVYAQLAFSGEVLPDTGRFGSQLATTVPLVTSVPGGPTCRS